MPLPILGVLAAAGASLAAAKFLEAIGGPIDDGSDGPAAGKSKPCEPADTWFRSAVLPQLKSEAAQQAATDKWLAMSCRQRNLAALAPPAWMSLVIGKRAWREIENAVEALKDAGKDGVTVGDDKTGVHVSTSGGSVKVGGTTIAKW